MQVLILHLPGNRDRPFLADYCQFSIKIANDRSADYSGHSLCHCRAVDAMHSFQYVVKLVFSLP